jgi:lipoate synthase
MALQMQTFTNVTEPMFDALVAKIKADTGQDVAATANETVTVVHGSFVFTYNYDPATKILQVQCLKKPLFIPASTIINGLAEEIAEIIATIVTPPVA